MLKRSFCTSLFPGLLLASSFLFSGNALAEAPVAEQGDRGAQGAQVVAELKRRAGMGPAGTELAAR